MVLTCRMCAGNPGRYVLAGVSISPLRAQFLFSSWDCFVFGAELNYRDLHEVISLPYISSLVGISSLVLQ